MASDDDALDIDYDEPSDVLYASLGPPQAALSYEIVKDIWLDYVPPNRAVVGITVVNFLQHYPVEDRTQLLTVGKAVVQDLLQRYPSVPSDVGSASSSAFEVTLRITAVPELQSFTSAATGLYIKLPTSPSGLVMLFETPRVHGGHLVAKDEAA
jgi:uncharacterized protein YuzE